jgi:hypothetical protein
MKKEDLKKIENALLGENDILSEDVERLKKMTTIECEIRMAYNIGALAYQTFVLNNPVDLGIDDFKASKEGYVMGIKMMLNDQSSNKNERYLS